MRDWPELVRQRLAGLELDSAERDEVHEELAGHLEESYEAFCEQGLRESEAAMTLQKVFGVRPRIVGDASGPGAILFYVPWLAVLPFIGALGAYISSRAGGSRRTVLLASMFPAVALATAFLLMFPIGMIVEWVTRNDLSFKVVAIALLSNWIGWIVVPGVALLAGGLIVHLIFGRGLSSRGSVIGRETTHA